MASTIPGAHRPDNRLLMQNFDTILRVFGGWAARHKPRKL
jgi:hypothetical protein